MSMMKWCCENPKCRRLNLIERSQVDDVMKKKTKVLLICETCGFVHNQEKLKEPDNTDQPRDHPYINTASRIPTGRLPDGTYTDCNGKRYNRNDFIMIYGIDPERWFKWRDAGMPRYEMTCE